jgi:hypothetical protein
MGGIKTNGDASTVVPEVAGPMDSPFQLRCSELKLGRKLDRSRVADLMESVELCIVTTG